MRAIINKKIYDTDTATDVAEHDANCSRSDFRYYFETLYKTKNGSWFLSGEGGAMSKYSVPEGNGRGYGRAIIPLSDEEAIEWLEETEHYDELEEHFAEYIQEA